jgi:transcriptional regulator with XRE-family HTH domain
MFQGVAMVGGFGRRLKALREQAGVTQEALARTAGLSTSAIAKLEQRDLDPSWSTVQALAKALGVSCDDFAADEPNEPEEPEEPPPPPPAKKPAPKKPKR